VANISHVLSGEASGIGLDTRRKIVTPESIIHAQPIILVTGFFDPLLASHATRLASLRRDEHLLAVLLSDPPDPVLPLRARAELVAALEAVDFVMVADGDEAHHNSQSEIIELIQPSEIVREEENDRQRRRDLIVHAHARQP
jgi:bifunctional ADP-heptose synthase (sugar kinase/adenylyltransferase)